LVEVKMKKVKDKKLGYDILKSSNDLSLDLTSIEPNAVEELYEEKIEFKPDP
jgi:hypothetical protein